MKANLLMDFSANKEAKTVTVKREFAAEVPQVWDAFTKSEILDRWWAPKPWVARTKSMNFTEGGTWLYAMVGPAGEEHWSFLTYKTIQPQKGFTAVDGFCDKEGNINKEMPQSNWNTTFNKAEAGTLVVFQITYADLAQMESFLKMGFQEGFTIALQGLDELLASKSAAGK